MKHKDRDFISPTGIFFEFFLFFPLKLFSCVPFLKSLLNVLKYCFCFMFLGHKACRILAPWLGIEPISPALKSKVLTAGPPEKSLGLFFLFLLFSSESIYVCLQTKHPFYMSGHCTNRIFWSCFSIHISILLPFKSFHLNLFPCIHWKAQVSSHTCLCSWSPHSGSWSFSWLRLHIPEWNLPEK